MTISVAISDEELALRAHAGEREAFGGLYERHLPGVYDFIARMSRDRNLAEDVAQSAFVNAWRDLQRRKVTGNIKAWLYTIARNEALNQLRHRKRVVAGGDDLENYERTAAFTDLDASRLPEPEAALVDKELVDLVWESATALSAKEYSLLDMHLRRGLTADELAASLGVRRGNVYVMLSRLRDSLEESVTSALLMRRGRGDCPQLDGILTAHGASGLNRQVRRSIQAHLRDCSVCQESKRRYVAPAEIFTGLALIPLPEGSEAALWAAVTTAAAAGGAAASLFGRASQRAARWWGDLSLPSQLAIAGGVTMGVALVVGGAIIIATSGGGASRIADPADVRSTSHEIGEPSDENVISVSWSPQEDADGYSVEWSASGEELPDAVADLPGEATGTRSPTLTEGAWDFNLRTLGNGEWTGTVHLGPFLIEGEGESTVAPEGSGNGGDSADGTASPSAAPAAPPTAVAEAISGPSSSGGDQDDASPPPPPTGGLPTTSPPSNPSPTATAQPTPTRTPKPAPSPTATPTPTPTPGDDGDDDDEGDDYRGDCDPEKRDGERRHRDRCRHGSDECGGGDSRAWLLCKDFLP